MGDTTAGQAAYEAMHASMRERDPAHMQIAWDDLDEFLGWDGLNRSDMHAAASAVETEQLRLVREDRDQLKKRMLDLAGKWNAAADRNQRNGQSLLDQGDDYGSEGLAIAEALGACVVELRKALDV